MKYIKFMMMVLLMIFFTNQFFSQSLTDSSDFSREKFEKIYLGNLYLGYKDCYLKLDTSSGRYGCTFYTDLNAAIPFLGNNVAYPKKDSENVTDTKFLVNRIFKVISITDKDSLNTLLPTGPGFGNQVILELQDVKNMEKIYYKYDTKHSFRFPFFTTEPNVNNSLIELNFTKSYDEFENKTTFKTPPNSVELYRIDNNSSKHYFLFLETVGSTLNNDINGVIVLFNDGTKWEKPNQRLNSEYKKGNYIYKAVIPLTTEELKLLQSKSIIGYRLYIYDRKDFSDGFIFKKYAQRIDKI